MEDATVFADNFDWKRAFGATLTSDLPDPLRDAIEMDPHLGQGEISWSALNIPLPLYKRGLSWWEENYSCLGFDLGDLRTSYYWYRDNWFAQWYLGRSENEFLVQELQRTQGGIEATALAMLESSSRARRYWSIHNLLPHELSAYTIALGVIQFRESDETLYTVSGWKSPGSQGDWVEAIAEAGEILGFHLAEPKDYLRYTEEEKLKLNSIR